MKNFPVPLFFADTSKKLLVNTQSAKKSFFQTLNNYALFETLLLQCVVLRFKIFFQEISLEVMGKEWFWQVKNSFSQFLDTNLYS